MFSPWSIQEQIIDYKICSFITRFYYQYTYSWKPESFLSVIAPNFVCQKCFGCYELPVHLLWCILIASQSFLAIVGISSSLQRILMKIYVFRVSCFHLGTPRKSTCTWSCGWEKFPCTLHRHRRSTISRTRPRGTRQKSSNVTFFTSWTLLHSPPPLAFNCPLHSQLFGWPAECVYSQLRGAFKSNFWNCLGFCPN